FMHRHAVVIVKTVGVCCVINQCVSFTQSCIVHAHNKLHTPICVTRVSAQGKQSYRCLLFLPVVDGCTSSDPILPCTLRHAGMWQLQTFCKRTMRWSSKRIQDCYANYTTHHVSQMSFV